MEMNEEENGNEMVTVEDKFEELEVETVEDKIEGPGMETIEEHNIEEPEIETIKEDKIEELEIETVEDKIEEPEMETVVDKIEEPEMENLEDKTEELEMEDVEDKIEEPEMETVEDKIEEPKANMMFDSLQEVHRYYVRYAKQMGFAVSTKSSQKSFEDGQVRYATFACNRYGKSRCTPKNMFRPNLISKTECKAKLNTSLYTNGKWRISSVVIDHNHVLSPGKSQYYRCHRVIKPYVKRKIGLNDRDGIRMNKNYVEDGGHENLTSLEKDCKNYIVTGRRLRLRDGDAIAIQKFFLKMVADNSNFFYIMDLDEEGLLKNIFWADARSRAAYEEFGDVIIFDTTYLTKQYDIPFVSFIGINHHGQSILLGCGLISSEDTNTFTWLFESWLACMSGCAPAAIITDQDKAIQNAIEVTFPNARHRWWLWHIMKKISEKLKGQKEYKQIKSTLHNVVYDSLTPFEFEESWKLMVEKFKLDSNDWLVDLFNERRRWVPAFVKDSFWAGISTTGRSESMQGFFDGYANSKTTMKQFVEQYENALRSKVEKENLEDFNSFNSWVPCITHYDMEKQLQEAYTTTKFREFQDELTGKMYCELSSAKEIDAISEYEVFEDVKVGERLKRVNFKVSWNKVESEEECEVTCSCCSFEFRGILCRHAISVLIHKRIYCIPTKYIIQRWRKDLKRRHTKVKIIYDDWSAKPEGRRLDEMCNAFHKIADLASESEDKYNMVMNWMHNLEGQLHRDDDICGSSEPIPRSNSDRCCPPFKRKQDKVDQIVKKIKEKKKKIESEGKKTKKGKGKDYQIIESEKIVSNEDRPIKQVAGVTPTQESIAITDSQITQNVHVYRSDGYHPSMLQFHNVPLGMGMPHMPIGMSGFHHRPPAFAPHQLYFGQGSQGYFTVDPDSAPENLVYNRTDTLHDSYLKSGNK